jgi:hypothetical protein
MAGIMPNFDDWRNLSAIEIRDIAILMQGYDPRAVAAGEVVVNDLEDPSNLYGVPPDASWEEKTLLSAVFANELTTAPSNVSQPDRTTKVMRRSLIIWLRSFSEYKFLADGLTRATDNLSSDIQESIPLENNKTHALTGVTGGTQSVSLMFPMSRLAMIQQHEKKWRTIAADIRGASENGLHTAKAGTRGWDEGKALEWARSKGKLFEKPEQMVLDNSMKNMIDTRYGLDD